MNIEYNLNIRQAIQNKLCQIKDGTNENDNLAKAIEEAILAALAEYDRQREC